MDLKKFVKKKMKVLKFLSVFRKLSIVLMYTN